MQTSPPRAADRLEASDLAVVLALARGGSLARAGQALAVDASTVFRTAHRLEQRLGQRLFERSRQGWRPTEIGQALAAHAERIEAELDLARGVARSRGDAVAGTVRISTTDTLLQGLLLPALGALAAAHPRLQFELHAGNEPVSLTRRDADIALRATRQPPAHLVGRPLGVIRSAVYAARPAGGSLPPLPELADCPWIAPEDALPDHPSVRWRRRHLPQVQPRYRMHSIGAVLDAISEGLGVGIVPLFLAARHAERLVAVSEPLAECDTRLWLLTHTESRHLRRISAVSEHLARSIALP